MKINVHGLDVNLRG